MTETVRSPSGSEPWDATTINPSTNRVADAGWTYDNAGNVTKNPTAPPMTIGYDGENRQVAICQNMTNDPASCPDQAGTGRILYVYDGLGNRVQRIDPSGNATTYVYDAFGKLAAEYGGTSSGAAGTQYVTVDALGSTRLVMAGTQASERHDFQPYGYETYASGTWRAGVTGYGADTMRQKFTGQERDNESGLDFFQARYYAAGQGRFASPDPGNAGANPADPQSWNGYAYVSNNPLMYTDPSGMIGEATTTGATIGTNICGPVCTGVGIGIGAAIDLGLALYGLFGGGSSQADLSSVASTPVTLQPSPSADAQGYPADSDPWNDQPSPGAAGGGGYGGGVYGGGSSSNPFIFNIQSAAQAARQMNSWWTVIQIHLDKIAREAKNNPEAPVIGHWRGEIAARAQEILRKAAQVTKGRSGGAEAAKKFIQRTLNVSAEEVERLVKTQIIFVDPCLLDPMGIRMPSCRYGAGGGVMY